jgi:hypothetical protein
VNIEYDIHLPVSEKLSNTTSVCYRVAPSTPCRSSIHSLPSMYSSINCNWRGPLRLVSTTGELLGRKSSGSGLENRGYDRRQPSRWPRGTRYPQKFALTSPTSGGPSVGIVRSWTQAMEFSSSFNCNCTCNILIVILHHFFVQYNYLIILTDDSWRLEFQFLSVPTTPCHRLSARSTQISHHHHRHPSGYDMWSVF